MLLSWLGRLHGVFAAWVLLFLISSLVLAAGSGFRADRGRYPDSEMLSNNGRPRFITQMFRPEDLKNRTVLLLDAPADSPNYIGMPPHVIDNLVKGLESKQMRVVRTSGGDPIPLAKNADVAVLTCNFQAYLDLDFHALAAQMNGIYLFDYSGYWDTAAADAAGLLAQNFARAYWPQWLDPELSLFVDYMEEKTSPEDGILLVPSRRLSTTAARARWFLALNEQLIPRRFYLRNPQDGTSFVIEYFEWVQEYNKLQPWKQTQKVRLPKRDFSALHHLSPTRTLAPEEIAAAQSRDIQWILYWDHQADFRLVDWELVPLETAMQWTGEASR